MVDNCRTNSVAVFSTMKIGVRGLHVRDMAASGAAASDLTVSRSVKSQIAYSDPPLGWQGYEVYFERWQKVTCNLSVRSNLNMIRSSSGWPTPS